MNLQQIQEADLRLLGLEAKKFRDETMLLYSKMQKLEDLKGNANIKYLTNPKIKPIVELAKNEPKLKARLVSNPNDQEAKDLLTLIYISSKVGDDKEAQDEFKLAIMRLAESNSIFTDFLSEYTIAYDEGAEEGFDKINRKINEIENNLLMILAKNFSFIDIDKLGAKEIIALLKQAFISNDYKIDLFIGRWRAMEQT